MAAATWHDTMAAGSIVVSAGTYLFDFGTNVVILFEYWTRYKTTVHDNAHVSSCNAACRFQTTMVAAYLYSMLAILAVGHSLNALLFKLKFTARHEAPIVAAYFLPLTHLYRLLHLLWCTVSCQGVQDIISPKMRGLYCILATAMEGIPMLNLQFIGYQMLRQRNVSMQRLYSPLKVSIVAALISATCNGGTSVHSIANNATTLKQKLCAGAIGASFTLNATLVRCLTFTYLGVYIQEYIWTRQHKTNGSVLAGVIIFLIFIGSVVVYCLYFWLLYLPGDFSKRLRSPRRLLVAFVFGYMSTVTSPLYPLIDQAKDANQLGSYIFRLNLLIVSLLHFLLDLTILCVTRVHCTLPKPYLIVSSLAALGYIFSLLAYMKFDASCGPILNSNVSFIQATHGGNTNVHDNNKLSPLSELCILTNAHLQKTKKLDVNALVSQHEKLSYQNSNMAMCQNAKALDCALESKKSNRSAPHSFDMTEAKARVPLFTSSLSLDKRIQITIKRRPSLVTWPSLKRYSRSYSL